MSLSLSTIDDVRRAQYLAGVMDKGHKKPQGHDALACPTCCEVAEIKAQISQHKANRAEWLARQREQDKRSFESLERRIHNFKYNRRVRAV